MTHYTLLYQHDPTQPSSYSGEMVALMNAKVAAMDAGYNILEISAIHIVPLAQHNYRVTLDFEVSA